MTAFVTILIPHILVPVHNIGKERTVRNITIAIILHVIIMELVSTVETPFLVCAHRDSWDTLAML